MSAFNEEETYACGMRLMNATTRDFNQSLQLIYFRLGRVYDSYYNFAYQKVTL